MLKTKTKRGVVPVSISEPLVVAKVQANVKKYAKSKSAVARLKAMRREDAKHERNSIRDLV